MSNLVCSSCGAQLKVETQVLNSITCEFCGVKTDVSQPQPDSASMNSLPRKCVINNISEKAFTAKLEQLLNTPQFRDIDKDMPALAAKELLFHPIGFFKGNYSGTYDVLDANGQKIIESDIAIANNFDLIRSVGDFSGSFFPGSAFLKNLFEKLTLNQFTTTAVIEKSLVDNQIISTLLHTETDTNFIKTALEETIYQELKEKNKNDNLYRVYIDLNITSSEIVYYPFWNTSLNGSDDIYVDGVFGEACTAPINPITASVQKKGQGCMPVLVILILSAIYGLHMLF